MADVHISDHILYNILGRLPVKALLRFQCVSKHWNHFIKDPSLMKLRSRRMILLSCKSLVAIDDNVQVDGTTNSVVEVSSLFGRVISIMGTFKGIVLLILEKDMHRRLILYNPFTRVSKMLPNPPYHYRKRLKVYPFGFGYGATMDDLKIVMIRYSYNYRSCDQCVVFSFRNSSWEKIKHLNIQDITLYDGDVGKFLNGFLYWMGYYELHKPVIVALNVSDMVFSKINPPVEFSSKRSPLGTIDGCLCMIDKSRTDTGFNVWVMKEQGVESSWTKTWSFPLRICVEGYYLSRLRPVCILDSGRILIFCSSDQLVMYNTSKDSFKILNFPEEIDLSYAPGIFIGTDGMEYVESLVSPSDFCVV